ncbi:MAG: nitroreductase family deazaflavin-dependent oxidoreductase [Acidimicrobiaceae bacterium]|nr:nitroreductase family deazaflavin-dependent oxidoreductase [Acidimicrobiaceae bacterium]
MPSDLFLKTANVMHRAILGITRGRVGWRVGKMPVLELSTTGRKSGVSRSVMLTSPLQESNAIVIVASRGGDDQHPAWFLNLRDNPQVEVAYMGKPKSAMTARVATDVERARMWPLVTARYKGYAGYQTKTTREIPLVILSEG